MGSRRRVLFTWSAAAALLLAACGSSGGDDGSPPKEGGSDAEVTTTTEAPPTAEPTEIEVGLADYSFDIDDTITGGPVRFVATNTGKEEHQLTLVKLQDGQGLGDIVAALQGDTAKALETADLLAGPNGVAPGGTVSTVVDLEPGKYVALCAIPSADDHQPHAAKGMLKEITVEAPAEEPEGSVVPPKGTPTITLADYRIDVPKGFTGKGTFRVEDVGSKPHELAIYQVKDGKTYEDAEEFLTGDQSGEWPVTPMGGITPMSKGRIAGVELDLDPGTYVFMCFLPTTDGETHFMKGMIEKVEIE